MSEGIKNCKVDKRPPQGGWCAGEYMCQCFRCNAVFFGDKRALLCADCAYGTPGEQFANLVLGRVKARTAEGTMNENDEELLELAAKLEYGRVRRVKYDPNKHGVSFDVEPGQEMWFWGEEKI